MSKHERRATWKTRMDELNADHAKCVDAAGWDSPEETAAYAKTAAHSKDRSAADKIASGMDLLLGRR